MNKERATHRVLRPVSDIVPVAAVMTCDVAHVDPTTPFRDVIGLMRRRQIRSIVVTQDKRVVGIITNSDLLARGRLGVRLTLLPSLSKEEQARRLAELPRLLAQDVMTSPVVTTLPDNTLDTVAATMVRQHLKRLPVVYANGGLVGIVSRVDLLRTVARPRAQEHAPAWPDSMHEDAPLSSVMREDVPMLSPEAPLDEVVQAITATRLNRALVVSAERRVLGIVHARAVLERVTPSLHPPLVRSLVFRLPFVRPSREALEACTAAELMSTDVATAHMRDPLRAVIETMVEGDRKLVAVVDDEGRIVGVVDRADVLRGLVNRLVE